MHGITLAFDGHVIRAAGELTIYHAAALHGELMTHLEDAVHAELDLSQVSEIDSAGLQLIVALHREMTARGGTLAICGKSDAFQRTLTALGLAHALTGGESPATTVDTLLSERR